MSTGTRNMWIGASLALVLGAGELVAYQGIAPHARKLGDPGRVVLRAGAIVARDLSALVVERASHFATLAVLRGVEHSTRLYRVACRTLGVEVDAVPALPAMPAMPGCSTVVASEPDAPCGANHECPTTVRAVEIACPACPACPTRAEVSRAVERSVRQVTRRIVIRV
jgi:hypothetical protein